jgi:hypothetical protein
MGLTMARLALARTIAAITLTIWKRKESGFRRQTIAWAGRLSVCLWQ